MVGGQYAVASTGPGLGGPQSRATGGPATIPAYDVVLSFFVSLIPSDPIRTSWPALIAPFHNSVPLADTRLVAPIAFYISAASIDLESLGFAQNFLSSCELEAVHYIGVRAFDEEFREDVVFRGIQEKFRKPLA